MIRQIINGMAIIMLAKVIAASEVLLTLVVASRL